MISAYLLKIEVASASLYNRLALRAWSEGKKDLGDRLWAIAKEEMGQVRRLDPLCEINPLQTLAAYTETSQYRNSGPGVIAESTSILFYLGYRACDQDWETILKKLGSAELLLAIWYLMVLRDFKTAREELGHARANGVSVRYLLRGFLCFLGVCGATS